MYWYYILGAALLTALYAFGLKLQNKTLKKYSLWFLVVVIVLAVKQNGFMNSNREVVKNLLAEQGIHFEDSYKVLVFDADEEGKSSTRKYYIVIDTGSDHKILDEDMKSYGEGDYNFAIPQFEVRPNVHYYDDFVAESQRRYKHTYPDITHVFINNEQILVVIEKSK